MKFHYTARDREGNLVSGDTEAESREALAKQLQTDGLLLTSAEAQGGSSVSLQKIVTKLKTIGTIPLEEKIFFTQNLHVMLHSGISLSVAIKTLAKQTKNLRFKNVLNDIEQSVEQGTSFAQSLAKHQKIFGELFVNMIEAGETSGQLENTLIQLHTQMKKDHNLISKVRGAMIYPAVVIVAMVGVMIVVVTFVIPKITDLFTEARADLPLPTKILIVTSDFLINYGVWVIIFLILLAFGFFKFIKTERGKKIWHKILVKGPIVGPIIKKINLARFSRTLSSLIKTDIPIVKSFTITSKTVGNYYYKNITLTAAEQLKKGSSITTTLATDEDLFPPLITQMISVGEESGSLDDILENLAIFYEEDVTDTMANFSSIIEPVLILILGLGVGAIAVSVIMPLYSLTQNI
ncbi:MAG: type II secretion system F family protein [Patescibacteria group bacterium]